MHARTHSFALSSALSFALSLLTLCPLLARAESLPPQKPQEEPDVTEEGATPPPKPGKRKFYVVEVEEVAPPTHKVTVLWEPLQLLYPIVQLGVEVRASDEFSVAVIGGYGSIAVDKNVGYTGPDKIKVFEVGAQAMYYAMGDFNGGMQVGVEALYMHGTISGPANVGTAGAGSGIALGLAIGPLIGWKIVTKAGFSFVSQIGVGLLAAKQKNDDVNAPKDDRSAILLGNLGIGWSF